MSSRRLSHLRVAFVINDAAFFVSHRLPIALKVKELGGEVCLISGTGINKQRELEAAIALQKSGIEHFCCSFSQGFKNPIAETYGFFELIWYLRKFRPCIVHSATNKGNLLASIACNFLNNTKLIISVSGMGTLFTDKVRSGKKIMQIIFSKILHLTLKRLNFRLIFQNREDYSSFREVINFEESLASIIMGSGVDTKLLKPSKSRNKRNVLLPARILYEKGIAEYVEASRILQKQGIRAKFLLAGDILSVNPSSIPLSQIRQWEKEGLISYLGFRRSIKDLYKDIAIVCLPSYREGFPKVLMEAASLGLPVITTDVPGCRDAVINNKTGLLVPHKDSKKLAFAIKKLFLNRELQREMGLNNRKIAVKKFDIRNIVSQIIKLYND